MSDAAPKITIARAVDYLLGRNTLIGIASFMLLLLSGYATWHGMRDFIVGSASGLSKPAGAGFSLSDDVLVIGVVVALTFLMWLMLREAFGAKRRLGDRVICFVLYVFLALWSIGFGYGFWWALISGQEATRTGLSGLQEDARDAAGVIAARLDAVRGQIDNVASWSEGQMSREETSGGSCGTSSGAGRGPLYNARRSVRDSVNTLREGINRNWLQPMQADVEKLRQAAAGFEGGTLEERQRKFEAMAAEIRGRARAVAARSNELGKSTSAEMRALAAAVSIQPGAAGFSCYDPTLAQRLKQAADQAEVPAALRLREAAFSEGPAGVANAVKNLWRNVGAYGASLGSWIVSGKSTGATDEGEAITGRDLIALLATIGIDLGLLVLAMLNPPQEPPPVRPSSQLRNQINDAIDTAVARAPDADRDWVMRHFLHHNRASYLVIPNLASCDPKNVEESAKALAMNQLAGVLSDLELVRWPTKARPWLLQKSELQKLKAEEANASDTDLTAIEQEWEKKHGITSAEAKDRKPVRNHGLFSKAERALQIAGWSEQARRDVEIFTLVETDGLTPLLMVLNERDGDGSGAGTAASARAAVDGKGQAV